ncbi:MAG TPA: VTT domain-containing protein [Bellilinea sp.]|nr:VTT domain-containing protein [Bellilinea sp.]
MAALILVSTLQGILVRTHSSDALISDVRILNALREFRSFAPIVYIFLIAVSVVIAPIGGLAIWTAGYVAFGIPDVVVLSYIGGLVGASVAFLLARQYGLRVFKRWLGRESMTYIEQVRPLLNWRILFVLRLFQSNLFDWISYTAGLSDMSFKTYIYVTAAGSLPSTLLTLWLLTKTVDQTHKYLSIVTAISISSTVALVLSIIGIMFVKRIVKKNSNTE